MVSPGLLGKNSRILKVRTEGPRALRLTKALVEADKDGGQLRRGMRMGGNSSGGCLALMKPRLGTGARILEISGSTPSTITRSLATSTPPQPMAVMEGVQPPSHPVH